MASRGLLTALFASLLLLAGLGTASAEAATPEIESVSPIFAQNISLLIPGGEESGPGIVIKGKNFGSPAPLITESKGHQNGQSAVGIEANTENLEVEDVTANEQCIGGHLFGVCIGIKPEKGYMGRSGVTHKLHGECYVTIGRWTDTEVLVLLSDTGFPTSLDCNEIGAGDKLRLKLWNTEDKTESAAFEASEGAKSFTLEKKGTAGVEPEVTALSPAYGPAAGGTFGPKGEANANGEITITGKNFAGATIVWFGEGHESAVAVPASEFQVSPDGTSIKLKPPPAPAPGGKPFDEGVFVAVTTPSGGTSQVESLGALLGEIGTYYYETPSEILKPIKDELVGKPENGKNIIFKHELSFEKAIAQTNSCPGVVGGTGVAIKASAEVEGGPVAFEGTPETSQNAALSSLNIPLTVHIAKPVNVNLSLDGHIGGCIAVPLGDLQIPDVGGLYILIGGSIDVNATLTIHINEGDLVINAGYVPNQFKGAEITEEKCHNEKGAPEKCVTMAKSITATGKLEISPLWIALHPNIGAAKITGEVGPVVAATVQYKLPQNTIEGDVCFGVAYHIGLEVADKSLFNKEGILFGPFNLIGNGALCGLGEISEGGGGGGQPTTLATKSSAGGPVAPAAPVTYTAEVSPTTATGTVGFTDTFNGTSTPLAGCQSVSLTSGKATCEATYQAAETGQHSVVATYSGDGTFAGSAAPAIEQEVAGAPAKAPAVVTEAATELTASGATLHASVNPQGEAVSECTFEYGPTAALGSSAPCVQTEGEIGTGSAPVPVTAKIADQLEQAEVFFRITAKGKGKASGEQKTFKTTKSGESGEAVVQAEAATAVAKTTATLNASVNPDGKRIEHCEFEWGTATDYGSTVTCDPAAPGEGNTPVKVTGALTGLAAETEYHARLVVTNASGEVQGEDVTFTTAPEGEKATAETTEPLEEILTYEAAVVGNVNPNGGDVTSCQFEYGTSVPANPEEYYEFSEPCSDLPQTGATQAEPVYGELEELEPNTTYHVRVAVEDAAGRTVGNDVVFTTQPPPPVPAVTGAASAVTETGATLNGTMTPGEQEIVGCEFVYGKTTAYGASLPCSPLPSETSPFTGGLGVAVSAALTGLAPGTTYHVQLRGSGTDGEFEGQDVTFTTAAVIPPAPAPGPAPPALAPGPAPPGPPVAKAASFAELLASLRGQLTPSSKSAKIAALLKHGSYTLKFKALEAGKLVISWYYLPPGAKLASKAKRKPVVFATGRANFAAAGTAAVSVKLTPAAKRMLKHAKQITLSATGSFTPANGAKVATTVKKFVLKK